MNDLNKNNGTPEKGEYIGRYEKTADNDAVSSRPLKPLRPLKKARSSQNNISNGANVPPVRAQNAPEHPKIHNKKRNAADKEAAKRKAQLRKQKKREKRRNNITKAIAGLNVAAVGGLLAFGSAYMLFFEHETISQDENRYLTKFPEFSADSYFKGEYTEGIADYYDDTVPNRDKFKKFITSTLMPLKGRKYGNDEVELHGIAFEKKETETTTSLTTTSIGTNTTALSAVTETTTTLPKAVDPAVDGEMANNILIANNRGIMIYGGAWGNEKEYAEHVNAYKEALPKVNVYSLVAPTACSFYTPENYKDLFESEKKDIDSIKRNLKDVTAVDAYTPLLAHKNEDIYSRTDHHWQPLGAYYAAEAFAEAAEVDFDPIEKYQKVTLYDFVGTLYGYTQSAALLNNPEKFIYYKPKNTLKVTQYDQYFQNPSEVELFIRSSTLDTSSYYMVFGSDERIVHVNNPSCRNGRNLVIFKDSYGNALLPVLANSFENIYMCDIRYFKVNAAEFAKDVKCTDMLFAMCTYSAVGPNRDFIEQNLHN
ncbi:MAG: hypothetical protein IIZ53_03530 [Ruminococcus sp.]|nr:hypothetical protein [Ruminococcus sp.]